jgi:site-specific DNA recombinase
MNAIYVRVSTEEQAKTGYSLPDQISSCKAHLLKQGYNDAVEYIDDGYSGEFSDRPAFSALRDDIGAGRIKTVVVYDPDRLARKLAVQLLFAEDVEKAGVQLQFVTGDYDASPEGRLFFSMRGAIAEFEKEKIKDRTMRGKRKKSSQGKIMQDFGLYGYDFDPATSTYIINEEQAKVIREIFRLVIEEEMSIEKVQKELQKRIIYSPKGRMLWGTSSLFNILKNKTYTGTFQSMRIRAKKDGVRSKKISVRSENEWIPVPVPVIIDEVTFKQAQRQLQKNKATPRKAMKHAYLVGGIIFCGVCGRRMLSHHNIFKNGTTKPYYQCAAQRYANLRNAGVTCSSRTLPADALDQDVWEKLIEVIYDHDKITNYLPQQQQPTVDYTEELARITEIESNLIKRRQTIIKWSGQGMISENEADEELKQIKMQLLDIEERKKSLQLPLSPAPISQVSFDDMANQLRPLIERGELTPENKKLIIQSVIGKITAVRTDKRPISKNLPPIFEFTWELA